ncbi:MAG: hypothetical protein J7L66_01060 [Anaerolineaceae bacterium]|nr:hypothetical protein [Anaerolineaceae bacterium]
MAIHLYLSLIPEALIASMLTPEEFGTYYAVGTQKKSRGQAIFFEIDPRFRSDYFNVEAGIKRCVPHEDGLPKASIYISVYRVLENVPMRTFQKLYLTTKDRRTLGLEKSKKIPGNGNGLHLYREISPVSPLVVSSLGPKDFYELIVKEPTSLIKLPSVCFAELRLDELAVNPQSGQTSDLPYKNIEHLRSCLIDLKGKAVMTKMVDRLPTNGIPFRMVKNGFFVGNQRRLLYFPLPSEKELVEKYYPWWRSATM